jgi:hypothetical protein
LIGNNIDQMRRPSTTPAFKRILTATRLLCHEHKNGTLTLDVQSLLVDQAAGCDAADVQGQARPYRQLALDANVGCSDHCSAYPLQIAEDRMPVFNHLTQPKATPVFLTVENSPMPYLARTEAISLCMKSLPLNSNGSARPDARA